jgi:hypothetical protein
MTRRSMIALCASLLVAGFARPQELYLVKVFDHYSPLAEAAVANGFEATNPTYPYESDGKWYVEWHGRDRRKKPWVYRLACPTKAWAEQATTNAIWYAVYLNGKQGGL